MTISSCKKDPCKSIECNNGTCIDGDCVCNPGFMGALCDQPDPCHNINCNNGDCVNGDCECEPGYTGTDCSVDIVSTYIGIYDAEEVCTSDPSTVKNYVAEVKSSGSGAQYMYITNLNNHFSIASPGIYQPEDTQVEVIVSSSGINIPEQFWSAQGLENYKVSGAGSELIGNGFSINFTLTDVANNTSDDCFVTYTLQ